MMIGISPEVMTDTNQLQSSKWKCVSVCIRLANSPTTAGFQTCEASYADQTRGLGDLWSLVTFIFCSKYSCHRNMLVSMQKATISSFPRYSNLESLGRSLLFPQCRVSMDFFFWRSLRSCGFHTLTFWEDDDYF